jgi:hypothetical protein
VKGRWGMMERLLQKGLCFLLLSFLGLGLISCSNKLKEEMELVLFTPYFKLLGQANYNLAYNDYTTADYKKKHKFEDFKVHWEKVTEVYGGLTGGKIVMTTKTYEIGSKRSFVSVKYKILFEDHFVLVRYEVVEIDESYKIDDSHLSSMIKYIGPW